MYWTGQVNGPDGENFSFFVDWIITNQDFVFENNGFLIPIKAASGNVKVWVTAEAMKALTDHDPSVPQILLKTIQARHREPIELSLERIDEEIAQRREEIIRILEKSFPRTLETPE